MKVTEFVYRFEKLNDDTETKAKMIKDHIKKTYLDYAAKIDSANKIVKFSLYDQDGNFRPNTPVQDVLFANEVIRRYTDLEFNEEDSLHDYDLLVRSDAMDLFFAVLNKDVARFSNVLDMIVDDTIDKERNMIDFISSILLQISDGLNMIAEEGVVDGGNSGDS